MDARFDPGDRKLPLQTTLEDLKDTRNGYENILIGKKSVKRPSEFWNTLEGLREVKLTKSPPAENCTDWCLKALIFLREREWIGNEGFQRISTETERMGSIRDTTSRNFSSF